MPRRLLIAVSTLAFLALAPGLLAAPAPCPPDNAPVNEAANAPDSYMGRKIARTMHYSGAEWLIRENRENEERCSVVMDNLGIRPGMTVCDMGCGNGYYALKLARMVGPEGRVLCVDIQPKMLELLRERAAAAGITNIEPILGTATDPRLPDESIDLILCVDVYHEFSHPEPMLQAMRRSLAKDGRLVLLEYRAEDPKVPIKKLHKMSKAQILKELVPNGFRLVGQFDELPWQHMMSFGKSDDSGARDTQKEPAVEPDDPRPQHGGRAPPARRTLACDAPPRATRRNRIAPSIGRERRADRSRGHSCAGSSRCDSCRSSDPDTLA